MLVGRVGFGESFQACPASYSCTEDAMARSIVRLECEADELRAEVAMLKGGMVILAQERDEARKLLAEARDTVLRLRKQRAIARNFGEQMERDRDEARVQFRAAEGLGMALVKTIGQLKEEKADLFVKLVNLQSGSRRSTLDEIAESVREKYEPQHEGEGIEN
jgi:cell division protein FtsB